MPYCAGKWRGPPDGTATYISGIGQRGFTITSEGPAESAMDMAPGSECIGKTLETLRSEGVTVEAGG